MHHQFSQESRDFQRIETAIRFIESHVTVQPSLDQIAETVQLSRYHFDRLFKRWAGITPIQFLHFLTLDYTKRKLAESRSVLDASLDAGLSGPGRLHDLFVTYDAVTPGDYKKRGRGLTISYGICQTPFGDCLLAATSRGICYLGFLSPENRIEAIDQLYRTWPEAAFVEDKFHAGTIVRRIFAGHGKPADSPFHLHLTGTNFQINVWKALLTIPEGALVSYQDVASLIGQPKAFRAAAHAIAINPVAYLIPCHRVITKSGSIHNYRWGTARKKALIGWEAAKTE
jgi:AraC family transcriptional regulator of adaptative response/methylated-DNA-[protein]-cysteine methyltransferase